ncbi:MAG TPA: glycosyltransferase family A protein [Hyphomonadaceae bacterium]|nr:glycosyltransferase family A protein [Hyphomonadaceae bacterium]HPI48261.1 glycosyltransferase family A protein [Hyphomonadaceae bacterium]HPN07227.1 glycosyltransferase family A protein [Hyphomonadaceae bacterium]
MPTFDVVVPCYNYSRFLEYCVKSALNQEGADVRVLIIDDCSSDDSAVVGQRLAKEDSRVEFRRHEQNQGHIATYNEGLIGWAKADYCMLLSADDALCPGAFARALKVFEASNDVGLVYGLACIVTNEGEFQFPAGNDFVSTQTITGKEFLRICCEEGNPVPTPTAIVRTALQQNLGGYRKDLPHTGDMEMWMRFARHGSVGIVRSVQAEYRIHGSNMSAQYYARVLSDRHELVLTCLDALSPILDTDADARNWISSMYTRLLIEAEQKAINAFDYGDSAAYEAWLGFAEEMVAKLNRPKRSRRLAARKLAGPKLWQLLRRAQKIWNPNLPDAQPLHTGWLPSHMEIIGKWPVAP